MTVRHRFDNENERRPPQESAHWQSLTHSENDEMLESLEDLQKCLTVTLTETLSPTTSNEDNTGLRNGRTLALWSCLVGYAEALAAHKKSRYHIFPIPLSALKRLVDEEWIPLMQEATATTPIDTTDEAHHRKMVQSIANTIWLKTLNKPNVRDEAHANSVYVWLRGRIDKKSIDCFGSALITIAGCHVNGLTCSQLALSEDHAYERHNIPTSSTSCEKPEDDVAVGTCEVAIPGNTKLAQSKRGRDIADTFQDKQSNPSRTLTPETSWLYMAANPVVCDTIPMTLVAVLGNINCSIEERRNGTYVASRQLYELKRDLLWVLHDHGHMAKFPFGLLELGDCEEHCSSTRSEEWVTVPDIAEPVLFNEKLFLDAIHINKTLYGEAQVYPYFCAGHYHKDAGNENPDQEYRLVHAMKHYADAARVASQYRYEGMDSLQLNKHMCSAALLVAEDILTPKYTPGTKEMRSWVQETNAVAVASWLLAFFDSLLYWEEQSGGKHFVEILSHSHKHGMGKLFQMLSADVREQTLNLLQISTSPMEDQSLPLFRKTRSIRLASKDGLLQQALRKPKVSIREMELAIPSLDDEGGGRRSKRVRRK